MSSARQRPSRRRFAFQILGRLGLCMLLGVATTALVAWALAAWLPHSSLRKRFNLVSAGSGTALPGTFPYVTVYELSRPGMVRRAWIGGAIGGGGATIWNELAPGAELKTKLKTAHQDRSWGDLAAALERGGKAAGTGVEDGRGWPYLALWCSLDPAVIESVGAGKPCPDGIALSRVNGKITTSYFRALPLRPIWGGLAANSGIYAATWLLGLALVGLARKWVRRRRGWCPECGYDLAGELAAGCSECGWNRVASA